MIQETRLEHGPVKDGTDHLLQGLRARDRGDLSQDGPERDGGRQSFASRQKAFRGVAPIDVVLGDPAGFAGNAWDGYADDLEASGRGAGSQGPPIVVGHSTAAGEVARYIGRHG